MKFTLYRKGVIIKGKFFCDLHGTYFEKDNINKENREKEILKFVELINAIKECENISFSFISTGDIGEIYKAIEELEPYLKDTKIHMDKCYSNDLCLKDGYVSICTSIKMNQIYFDLLDGNYDVVYYADESLINQLVVQKLLDKRFNDIKLVQFIPFKQEGIVSLNEQIEDYKHIKQMKKAI